MGKFTLVLRGEGDIISDIITLYVVFTFTAGFHDTLAYWIEGKKG